MLALARRRCGQAPSSSSGAVRPPSAVSTLPRLTHGEEYATLGNLQHELHTRPYGPGATWSSGEGGPTARQRRVTTADITLRPPSPGIQRVRARLRRGRGTRRFGPASRCWSGEAMASASTTRAGGTNRRLEPGD